jgi:formamidopyrimidine-DNA glycosylase
MYLARADVPLPKHAAVVLNLGPDNFIFEDTRCFGRLTFDSKSVEKLGPEPLGSEFSAMDFAERLKHSRQPIKIKLIDQSVVAGVGNIYASEALFRAGLSPRIAARDLKRIQVERLWRAVREVLTEAIDRGSSVPLDFAGVRARDGLFYYGRAPETPEFYEERLRVYDRAGQPCPNCATAIRRLVQGARSTFYCPRCQRG